MAMRELRLNSSSIRRVRYESSTNVLDIEFVVGGRYRYFAVPRSVFDEIELIASSGRSVGRFVTQRLKNSYPFERLTNE